MPPAVAPGTTIERYRVEAAIGAGSMGDVYRGVDIDLKRKVAIKILSERHRDNREIRARFVREARAVAAISHPNVVQVFTTGSYDNRPYIAMELLDGVDLGSSVSEHGPWRSRAAARAIRDAARGLDAAARAGLIHRDVKPSNLVQLRDGVVKVTDFGLAKPQDPGDEPALTALGVVVGTPDYIAPKQARGEKIDHRVDIYALGGTLFFLIAGIPPFRTGKPGEDKYLKVVARHLRQPAPDARTRNPDIDPELAQLARTMMAKSPDQRPSYADLIAQLSAIIQRLEAQGPGPTLPPTRAPSGGGRTSPTPPVGLRAASAEPSQPERPVTAPSSQRPGTDARAPSSRPARPVGRAVALPAWAVAITVIAALVFVTGLALTALGPRGLGILPATPEAAAPASASPRTSARADEATSTEAAPTPPPGMLLVTKPDGSPWFFVTAAPVTPADYAAIFPQHEPAHQTPSDGPVTGVSFEYAQAFARSHGKRLLTAKEWRAAQRTPGFVVADTLWEWIADSSGRDDRHTAIHPREGLATRAGSNAADVTFRLAKNP
ncbi:protein kinase domain-containing protein [Haliangium sp.]|uniref:bifunctional serine/threonine-protein kinase/formylglycine-generating enzyme family protein n=1 Tax=Haliangium sp. TaxID=2663208 RepID=UPI003D0C8CFF